MMQVDYGTALESELSGPHRPILPGATSRAKRVIFQGLNQHVQMDYIMSGGRRWLSILASSSCTGPAAAQTHRLRGADDCVFSPPRPSCDAPAAPNFLYHGHAASVSLNTHFRVAACHAIYSSFAGFLLRAARHC